ncbi:MAG: HlyD family efflux transporter periplasmic adaptor subunit [Planctomycetes bacterium]|nr:HlyD family efflux transporter periplasmic adaptor subunit [Planctomycetota bacterium]
MKHLALSSLLSSLLAAASAQSVAIGELVPFRELAVQAAAAGRVAGLAVARGDLVAAGQLLVRLEDPGAEVQVRAARAVLAAAEAEAEQARLGLEVATRQLAVAERDGKSAGDGLPRAKEMMDAAEAHEQQLEVLVQAGRASRADVQQAHVEVLRYRETWQVLGQQVKNAQEQVAIARLEVGRAEAGLQAARAGVELHRADLQAAELALDALQVRAPFAGHVHRVHAVPGQLVGVREQVLVELVDVSRLRVVFTTSAEHVAQLRQARQLEVRQGERRGVAALEAVDLVAVSDTGLFAGAALLEATDGWLAGVAVELALPAK